MAPEPKPQRGPEHDRLEIFIGDWRGKGAAGEGGEMTTLELYDWVEGKFFLTGRFYQDAQISHIGVSTIGFDRDAGCYRFHVVDNAGYLRDYDLTDDGKGVWTVHGERERARYQFKDGHMLVLWEHRPSRGPWQELCHWDAVNERRQ